MTHKMRIFDMSKGGLPCDGSLLRAARRQAEAGPKVSGPTLTVLLARGLVVYSSKDYELTTQIGSLFIPDWAERLWDEEDPRSGPQALNARFAT